MVTKAEVTEYVNWQFEDGPDSVNKNYWTFSRLGTVQQWMAPEVAVILQKLVGEAIMVKRIAKNRSNS